jgi:hypothetical protein
VDLRDLAEFRSRQLPEIPILLQQFKAKPSRYFGRGVRFPLKGVKADPRTRAGTVYGVELFQEPRRYRDQLTDLFVVALVHSPAEGFFFRRMQVRVSLARRKVVGLHIQGDEPLSDSRFSIEVNLAERMAVLTDEVTGRKKAYPLGVGAIDPGITDMSRGRTISLTPLFRDAALERSAAIEARSEPAHFKSMPFLRLVRRDGAWTAIAFHIQQGPKLGRGFESHGCLRLRERDLYELHALLMNQDRSRIPVQIRLKGEEQAAHPYPKRNKTYFKVKNFESNPDKPARAERDEEHNLIVLERARGGVPLADLLELDGDTMNASENRELGGKDTSPPPTGWKREALVPSSALNRISS